MRRFMALAVLVSIGCGSSPPPAPTPAHVAPAPEAHESEAASEAHAARTEPTPEQEPAEPAPASPFEQAGASATASTSAAPTVTWALIVRAPDGTETHHRGDSLPSVDVGGARCGIRTAGVDVAMSITNGSVTQRRTETRELSCDGGRPATASARCTVETSNGVTTPQIQPATIELGSRRRPSQVTLKCSVQ